jgi:hypothetical protein
MSTIVNYEVDTATAMSQLDESGYYVCRNLIDLEFISKLIDESHSLYECDPPFVKNKRAGDSGGSYRLNITNAKVKQCLGYDKTKCVNELINHPMIRKIVNTALQSESGVSNYIFDYSTLKSSKEASGAELFPLHYDWRDYSSCVKVYVYLNDITADQGAMRYVPGSHRVVKTLWAENPEEMQNLQKKLASFNSLENLVPVIKEHTFSRENRETISNLEFASLNSELNCNYAISGRAGDVLLFDENGVHGGGVLSKGFRHICRVHYVDRGYVNKRLPDQQSRLRRSIFWTLTQISKR